MITINDKRFKIYERIGKGVSEVVFSYPNFKSTKEGLNYIRRILDPYYTGQFGVVNTQNKQ